MFVDVAETSARKRSYDAAGNTLGYASNTFNQRGRMNEATVMGGVTNYIYNALGQLISKSGSSGTTLLMYDEAGHILGEYTGTGTLIQETIWMGNAPIATTVHHRVTPGPAVKANGIRFHVTSHGRVIVTEIVVHQPGLNLVVLSGNRRL